MKIVKIAVSPVTKKYLLATHGDGRISSSTLMGTAGLLSSGFSDVGGVIKSNANAITTLTVSIEVLVSNTLARRLEKTSIVVGWNLHNYVLEILCQWVRCYAAAHPDNTIADGIRDFYKVFGITDDDLLEESAYKRYSRFRNRLLRIDQSFESRTIRDGKLPLTLKECELASEALHQRTEVLKHRPSYSSCYSFLSRAFANLPNKHAATVLELTPAAVSIAYSRMSERYVRSRAFRNIVDEVVTQVRAGCTPQDSTSPVASVLPPTLAISALSLRESISQRPTA